MTLNELIKQGLHSLMTDAAWSAAESSPDPEECAAIPAAFFYAENAMWDAWLQVSDQTEVKR